MAGRVLFIEDDANIRSALGMFLEKEGYSVVEADSGEAGLSCFEAAPTDLVMVDVMLPGIDGFEVTRRLRRISGVPVLIVTARTDTHDVVAGLEAGADDYVTKPVVAKELAARLRALLRRQRSAESPTPTSSTFGDLVIREEAGVVTKGGAEVSLTKTEFRLLCELAAHPGWVLSRPQLLEAVWGYDYFGDTRLVDVHVGRLRAKVEDDPALPQLITTVRGRGYRLTP
jgi:DNA-binding response OmpR family regulator